MVTVLSWGLIVFLALERLWELFCSHRNVKALKSAGAVEYGAGHYPWMVLFHTGFFAVMVYSVAMGARLSLARVPWILLFALAQVLRWWSKRSLKERWSTRIIILPSVPLVAEGPYRFLRHPIYVGVFLEVLAIPMSYGLDRAAIVLTLMNSLILWIRINEENKALGLIGNGIDHRTGA